MRSLLKLLIILRDDIKDKYFLDSGLCYEIAILYNKKIITFEEKIRLHTFINNNRPKNGQFGYNKRNSSSYWYWPSSDVPLRLRWLNYWIAKIEKEESDKRT